MDEEWWLNVKPENYKEMTQEEWDSTPDDYKDIKPDGTKTVMHWGKSGTTISPVRIIQ